MENTKWYTALYNGLETNLEVTKCGRVRKVQKEWYGKGSGSYKIKYGEVNFTKLRFNKGYKSIGIQIKGLKAKTVLLHQLIAASFLSYKFKEHNLVVDHIDNNKQNNNINNLQIITQRENVVKEIILKKTLPIGVCFDKSRNKYMAQITINNKHKNLGRYNTPEEASQAYQNKLKTIL
jgi:hypothetical protein